MHNIADCDSYILLLAAEFPTLISIYFFDYENFWTYYDSFHYLLAVGDSFPDDASAVAANANQDTYRPWIGTMKLVQLHLTPRSNDVGCGILGDKKDIYFQQGDQNILDKWNKNNKYVYKFQFLVYHHNKYYTQSSVYYLNGKNLREKKNYRRRILNFFIFLPIII
ncbi:MAG: hypothetical protein CMM15_06515 [Rhodospirillaceae bacterium]|nr:hypothetical protein [Rhodospirillaceae bacterium]